MFKSVVKVCGSTVKLQLILDVLSAVEAGGIRMPMPVLTRPPTESAMGRSFRMAPKEPPAPVMARMAALSVTP